MGIIRKTMSVSTAGMVDFRSDKERTARYTKQTRNAARDQAKAVKSEIKAARKAEDRSSAPTSRLDKMAAQLEAKAYAKKGLPVPGEADAAQPVAPPAGWYADPDGSEMLRWHDGTAWTDIKKPQEG